MSNTWLSGDEVFVCSVQVDPSPNPGIAPCVLWKNIKAGSVMDTGGRLDCLRCCRDPVQQGVYLCEALQGADAGLGTS